MFREAESVVVMLIRTPHHALLARSVRAQSGLWDTGRAVLALADAGVTSRDQRAAEKQARAALRRLRDDGVLVAADGPGGTVVYRRSDPGGSK